MNKSQRHFFLIILSCILISACSVPSKYTSNSFVSRNGDTINTQIYLPDRGTRPFPVVIDLHGCNGVWEHRTKQWVPRLNAEGFAVLQIDSFGSRGVGDICEDVFKVAPIIRVMDVVAAIPFIERDKRLDKDNIFLLGMSHGGTTTLLTNMHASPVFSRLKGAIAYYPYCLGILPVLNTDMLILVGDKDDWTPASLCKSMHIVDDNGHDFELVVYPDAYHTFDIVGVDEVYAGHRVLYNHQAAEDSFRRVRQFLKQRVN